MKKFGKISGALALLAAVVLFAGATSAFAYGLNAPDDFTAPGHGPGPNGTGQGFMAVDEADMHAAIAAVLGMNVADFEAALADGATPATLAAERNIDFDLVLAAIEQVHADALQAAVDAQLITQEQADWMLSRRGGQNGTGRMGAGQQAGRGQGQMGAGRGQQGAGQGQMNGSGDCIYN